MFAPYRSVARLQGIVPAVGRPRKSVVCTPENCLNALIAASRSSSLESPTRSSWRTCSLGVAGIAQQMLDLQMTLQTDVRCKTRMVNPNLTAGSSAVYHPLTVEDGLGAGAM